MLFIRMQGWRGGMERRISTNKYGWDSCPQPQDPHTLDMRTGMAWKPVTLFF